jgi:molecular chaperone GrpE
MEEAQKDTLEGVDVAPGSAVEPEEIQKPVSEANGMEKELEAAKAEAAEMRDSWNRERAEFMNYKKRMMTEMGRVKAHAVKAFVTGLLPVLDNLTQVVQTKSEDAVVKSYVQGVEMIRSEFLNVLSRENIKSVRPVGAPFDPMSMEAIALEEREGLEKDEVAEVYQDGFVMTVDSHEEILRPARVKVARAKAASTAGGESA